MGLIGKALEVAVRAHAGQKDKGGYDYVLHPITVALHVRTEDEKVVALLHDAVEDTDVTLEDLRELGFSETIVSAVDALTQRNGEARVDYLRRVKENPLATAVKIADLNHNSDISRIPSPEEKDFARIEKYAAEIEFLQNPICQ